ncbi:Udp-glycosyltransferase 73c7 [Thalictrum thalictroides]|uniref:Udp-glycosyltransferase 73c7 n=1 Tax=Thalictrum thalictroides TaxID=46969 RepID=A0A7J6W1I6_THATH|nr:Udp-glycosyltransferase 73c7 [Thalictrum thalictroides]
MVLEAKYMEEYQKAKQKQVWCVGPVSLNNEEAPDKFERGNRPSIELNQCLRWLDSRQSNSVNYICLGSICQQIPAQLMELALGLEEQFLNEKLIVKILEIGIHVGVSDPVPWGDEEKIGVLVRKEEVEQAVNRLMDKGVEGEERRKRSREHAMMKQGYSWKLPKILGKYLLQDATEFQNNY